MSKLKLITETSYSFNIREEKESKNLYIMGIFSSAEAKNRNGRYYPKSLLEREMDKLMESIKQNTCVGQLSHPETPETDLEKAAILIEELKWKDNDIMGKAKVLSTPSGAVLKSLIKDNVRVGVSSRGLGTVNEQDGKVNDDFQLLTWDIVSTPSNYGSWVNGIYEGKTFESTDVKQPNSDEIQMVLKEHEKKVWQALKNFFGDK